MPISFTQAGEISGVNGGADVLTNPTSLQFGPDGRLYVSEQNGSINAFTVTIQDGQYIATDHEELLRPAILTGFLGYFLVVVGWLSLSKTTMMMAL